jgi:hypothetical protein
MKYFAFFFVLVTLSTAAKAQAFPEAFMGRWKGEITWYQQGKAAPQKIPAQLRVLPADSAGHFTWQIIYGAEEKDNRPYILKPVDTAKGHWVIDERNGIVLDQYWIGGRFSGAFRLEAVTIVNSYWIEGEELMIEFYTISNKSPNRTGEGTDASPHVDSFRLGGYQKGVLRKVKSEK